MEGILKKTFALIVVALGVAGCQTQPVETMSYADQQKFVVQTLNRCHAEGAKAGTPAEKQCFFQEVSAEDYRRSQNLRSIHAIGASLKYMGDASAAQQQNTVSCISNRFGNTTTTNCM